MIFFAYSDCPELRDETGDAYAIENGNKVLAQQVYNACGDVMTAWLGESSLKNWIRVWLCFLMLGCLCPLAFLPHPFAITNLVGMVVILVGNGRELIRVRGLNKNMGWPHLVGWAPVMIVNILFLSTNVIGDQVTWEQDTHSTYQQARFICLSYNTAVLTVSCVFDAVDTFLYHFQNVKTIERSRWTIQQLRQQDMRNIRVTTLLGHRGPPMHKVRCKAT